MDWIHCNKCFMQLEQRITLHLTSCGHMFCNICLEKDATQNTCFICRVPCTTMKLEPDMNTEVQDYFTDPEEIIKKSWEVLRFQKQHRRRLLSFLLQSNKKFYTARTELKRMQELCQKQHKQMKEYQKIIKHLESKLANQTKQLSPFNVPISPSNNLSPGFLQSTPSYKRTAKSTPYSQTYQSNLVTPARISRNRSISSGAQSQRSSTSNRISSTVFTPPTQESVGYINFLKHL
ncbi:PREDICTED: RING finger protein 212B-like [Papilio polytes]|uniref:RING finger protein 212B-like n=1 Tax=Papilio polytes TaxID=76194 RepID=UPI00067686F3|nr:PREDICTED: RING finger protein 212B-like [Papilio polytes]